MHTLSTEGNMSPFMEGINAAQTSNHVATDNQAPYSSLDIDELVADRVQVPTRTFEPCSDQLSQLALINPLTSGDDFGKLCITKQCS